MQPPQPILIRLETNDQLLAPCPASPFRKRRLREEAEKFLIEQATALPARSEIHLRFILPRSEAVESNRIVESVHEHFKFLRVEAEKKLREMRRFGWRSLVIALLFLTVAMVLVQLMQRYLRPGPLSSIAIEGMTILAWVALWRPGELLLYERYPFRREARLYRKLEESEIGFSYESDSLSE